jgi:hypothetical protein
MDLLYSHAHSPVWMPSRKEKVITANKASQMKTVDIISCLDRYVSRISKAITDAMEFAQ